jgi:acyl carrier protein
VKETTVQTATLVRRLTELLVEVAPDVDPATVRADSEFRDQFDFDSMDQLHFAASVSREYGFDVPESDYAQLASLASAARYVQEQFAARGGSPRPPDSPPSSTPEDPR